MADFHQEGQQVQEQNNVAGDQHKAGRDQIIVEGDATIIQSAPNTKKRPRKRAKTIAWILGICTIIGGVPSLWLFWPKPPAPIGPITNIAGNQYKAGRDLFAPQGDVIINPPPSPQKPLTPPHEIAPPPPNFTGRKKELEELERHVAQGGLVAIRGMGGMGKTALACALAERIHKRFPDGQVFFDLQGADSKRKPSTPEEILSHVIRVFRGLNDRLPETKAELQNLYRSALHEKRVLMLMDDVLSREQVEPLLPLPAGCVLIITSRQRFYMDGLHPLDLDKLSPDESRDLVLKIAPRTGDAATTLAKLCGCIPLALHLAASTLAERPDLNPNEYLADLRDVNKRLGLIEGALTSSLNHISESSRTLWARLAVFPKGFDREAVAEVWGVESNAAFDCLSEFFKLSLIEWDSASKRYYLHELVRDYAAAKIPEAERTEAERRHSAHYRVVLARANSLYLKGGEKVIEGLGLFDREWANIRAGRDWAAARAKEDETAARLCMEYPYLGPECLALRLHPKERIVWLESSLSTARKLGEWGVEGNTLGNLGLAYAALGEPRRAIEFHEQSLAIARGIGDRRGEGNALGNLGNAYADLGELHRAIEFYKQALVIDREIGDRQGQAAALGNSGLAYASLGETRRAIEFYEQCLAIARKIGDRQGEGRTLGNLGLAYAALGDPRRAIEFHEQCLAIARKIGDRQGEGATLGNLGSAYADLGDPRRAIEFYEQRLVIAREIGDRRGEGSALANSGLAYASLGETRRAVEFYEQALVIHREIGHRRGEGAALGNLGNAYADLGEPRRAIEFYEKGLAVAREIGDRRGEGAALWNKSLALNKITRRAEAISLAQAALTIFEQIEDPNAAQVRRVLWHWRVLPFAFLLAGILLLIGLYYLFIKLRRQQR